MSKLARPSSDSFVRKTANFVFKRRYGRYFGIALALSLLGHLAIILAMPSVMTELTVQQEKSMEAVDLPPEVVIPPPPRPLSKPSVPQMADEEIDEDITIEETTPPPPMMIADLPGDGGMGGDGTGDFLMTAEVMPKFKTTPKIPKMPSYLARAVKNATTVIEFYITATGAVDPRTTVAVSAGWPELDELAVEWAKGSTFHPALNRGEPVAVRASIKFNWTSK